MYLWVWILVGSATLPSDQSVISSQLQKVMTFGGSGGICAVPYGVNQPLGTGFKESNVTKYKCSVINLWSCMCTTLVFKYPPSPSPSPPPPPPRELYHQKSNNILAYPAAKKTGSNECNHMCRDLSYNLVWGQQFFRLKENKNIYSFDTKRRALLDQFAG